MLFKFAHDVELSPGTWLYGGRKPNDVLAQKSAGHELKAVSSLFKVCSNIKNFRVGLMCLVDYMGFRLSVQALLPIGEDTLIYGFFQH